MERYSLIVVSDETSARIRRFDVRRVVVKRAVVGAGLGVLMLLLAMVDWVGLRVEYPELVALRAEAEAHRAKIAAFEERIDEMGQKLERVTEFERKVRIIANLPGAAGTGGEVISEARSGVGGDLVEGEPAPLAEDEAARALEPPAEAPAQPAAANGQDPTARLGELSLEVESLGEVAQSREVSLQDLVTQLRKKHDELASSPAIWPTKGWLTSRFGNRTSPFTGRRQFHGGIDIAGRRGTDVVAPARGRVVARGTRGPLGKSITIDHGYGIRTVYGHLEEYLVERGHEVERGQAIAAMGSTGRSTGPHLHYAVEVKGKAVNPIDYIFD